jgi:hypothetical protein
MHYYSGIEWFDFTGHVLRNSECCWNSLEVYMERYTAIEAYDEE